MFQRRVFLGILAMVVSMAASARAAEAVLKIIPSDALAWAVAHRLSETSEKLQALGQKVQAPSVDLLKQVKDATGVQKGLDEKGSAGVIVMPGKSDEKPSMVYFLPVTDYKEFLGNFSGAKPEEKVNEIEVVGKTLQVANRDGYALMAEAKDRAALDKVLDSKKSLAGEVAGIDAWLAENNISLAATSAGVKLFAAKAQKELKKAKEQLGEFGDQQAAGMTQMVMDSYGQALEMAKDEVSFAAVGARVDKEGTVRIAKRIRFVSGGKAATALGDVKPAEGDILAGLPNGGFIFAMAGMTPKPLVEAITKWSGIVLKKNPSMYGLTPEQADKLMESSARTFKSIHAMALVMKTGKSGEPLYGNLFGSMRVDNSEQLLEEYAKQVAITNEMVKESKDSLLKPTVVKKTEIDGKPALQLEITIPVSKMAGRMPNAEAIMDEFFGPGGKATAYMVAVDAQTVVFGYATAKEKMVEAIATIKDPKRGLGGDSDVAVTAAMLPQGAQWIAYISPRGYMSFISRMLSIQLSGTDFGSKFKMPAFPKTPPVGVAVKAVAGGLDGELVIPAAVFNAIGEYSTKMRQNAMEQMQAP